jgi:hypothetical protein
MCSVKNTWSDVPARFGPEMYSSFMPATTSMA